jgi:copper chaperone CopZ
MRILRSIPVLAVLLATPLLLAGASSACTVSSAMVTGKFTDEGGFHVMSALTPGGEEISKLAGVTLVNVSTTDEAAITASDWVGRQIWLVGDVDGEARTLKISSWTDDKSVADAHVAKAVSAAGSGCSSKSYTSAGSSCSTKGASAKTASAGSSCSTKDASAKTASAGSSCSTKGAGAKTASAGSCCPEGASAKSASAGSCCPSMSAAATTASAGSGCSTKGASAKTANSGCSTKGATAQTAGSGCSSKGATAQTAGSGCSPKGASAKTAGSCGTDGAKVKSADVKSASGETYQIVYSVSGMTCGGCEGQVQSAVAALEMDGIVSVVASHQDGTAIVNCSSDKVCKETVQKAISGAGFPAELIVSAEAEEEPKNS